MRIAYVLTNQEVEALNLPVIVEMYDKVLVDGSKRRKYMETFTESERKMISTLYKKAYRWHLSTGFPQELTFYKLETLDLWKKACNFFGTL